MITLSTTAKRVGHLCNKLYGSFVCLCVRSSVVLSVCYSVCGCKMSVFNLSGGNGLTDNLINIHQMVQFLLVVVYRVLGLVMLP